MHLEMNWHGQDGELLPVALWCPGPGYRMISSGLTGGGIGPREWVLNAQVPAGYSRMDPAAHVAELAIGLGLEGNGVGLLTAARSSRRARTKSCSVSTEPTPGYGDTSRAASWTTTQRQRCLPGPRGLSRETSPRSHAGPPALKALPASSMAAG